MRLIPKRPPGRANRKALAFESEIGRLHVQGYSCAAIREALADAGLTVSRSTVIREVARLDKSGHAHDRAIQVDGHAPEGPGLPVAPSRPASSLADPRSGKDIAAAWVKDRNTNPLFRARTAHESGRH